MCGTGNRIKLHATGESSQSSLGLYKECLAYWILPRPSYFINATGRQLSMSFRSPLNGLPLILKLKIYFSYLHFPIYIISARLISRQTCNDHRTIVFSTKVFETLISTSKLRTLLSKIRGSQKHIQFLFLYCHPVRGRLKPMSIFIFPS